MDPPCVVCFVPNWYKYPFFQWSLRPNILGCDECFHIPTWYVNTLFSFSIIQVFSLNLICFWMSTREKQYVHIPVWSKVCTRSVCTNGCKSGFIVTGVKSTHSLDPPPFWYERLCYDEARGQTLVPRGCHVNCTSAWGVWKKIGSVHGALIHQGRPKRRSNIFASICGIQTQRNMFYTIP